MVEIVEKSRHQQITDRLFEINKEITRLGLTKSRVRQRPDTIEPEQLERRDELVKEQINLQAEITSLKKEGVRRNDAEWQNQLYRTLEEILGSEEIKRINREVLNRCSGGKPNGIKLNYGFDQRHVDEIKRLKIITADLLDKTIEARRAVDKYIRANEPEVNKGDYLKKVQPLSRCMPPEVELRKIKI